MMSATIVSGLYVWFLPANTHSHGYYDSHHRGRHRNASICTRSTRGGGRWRNVSSLMDSIWTTDVPCGRLRRLRSGTNGQSIRLSTLHSIRIFFFGGFFSGNQSDQIRSRTRFNLYLFVLLDELFGDFYDGRTLISAGFVRRTSSKRESGRVWLCRW